MDLFYRILGIVAALNRGLSHWILTSTSIPIAPLHWVLTIVLVLATYAFGVRAYEGFQHLYFSTTMPLNQVLERKDLTNCIVTVSGVFVSRGSQTFIKQGEGGKEIVEAVYVPFQTEEKMGPVLFVKFQTLPNAVEQSTTVTGRLRVPDIRLLEKAEKINKIFAPSKVDFTNVLDADDPPPNPWPFLALAIASGLFCGMMYYALFNNWTIYRRLGGTELEFANTTPEGIESRNLELLVTGSFSRTRNSILNLHEAPVQLVQTGTGEMAFVTMARSSQGPLTYSIVIKPGSIMSWDQGILYNGFDVHPAVRLRYIDGNTQKESVAFVIAPNKAQMQGFLELVNGTTGYKLA